MSGIDVNTLIDELRLHLGVSSLDADWTNSSCLLVLNRAFWELLNKFNFREKETTYTLSTVIGQAAYTVPMNFESIQSIGVQKLAPSLQWYKLTRIGIDQYQNWLNTNTWTEKFPKYYFRRDAEITIFPTPDEVYSAQVYYLLNLEDLALDGSVEIPREWHELILYGALWRAYLQIGDLDRANLVKNHQVAMIDTTVPVESKEETDNRLVALAVPPIQRLWR